MKIVYMTSKIHWSGAPKILAWLANNSVNSGDEVTIITYYNAPIEQDLDPRINFICLNHQPSSNWVKRNSIDMIKAQRKLCSEIKRISPDLIVSFLVSIDYLFLMYHKKIKIPMIVSERVDPTCHVWYMKLYNKFVLRKAEGIVFQTKEARDYYHGKIHSNSIVINNPAFIADSKKAVRDYNKITNEIVSTSRIRMAYKRQDLLLKAFAILHQNHPDLVLRFYGDGEDIEALKSMISTMGLDNCAFVMGPVKDLPQKIVNSRMFVLTSDTEGIPNSLFEALLMGIPCVSTDCRPGGARLLIENEENGLIVPRNDVVALVEAMERILSDDELTKKFSQNAPKVYDKFAPEKIYKEWRNYMKGISDGTKI